MRHDKQHHSQNPHDRLSAQLVVEGLTLRFGGITALQAVSFSMRPGTTYGLIGPKLMKA